MKLVVEKILFFILVITVVASCSNITYNNKKTDQNVEEKIEPTFSLPNRVKEDICREEPNPNYLSDANCNE